MKTLIIQNYDEYKNVNVMLSVNLTLTSSRNAVGFMLFGVLLAPSGALVVIMVYYIPSAAATHFFKFFKFFRF